MRRLMIVILLTATGCGATRKVQPAPEVQWLGGLVIYNGQPTPAFSDSIQVGIGSDGNLKWRNKAE